MRRDATCVFAPNPKVMEKSDRKTIVKHFLMAQRKEQSTKVANAMAKEAGIPVNLFKEKSRDFRSRHH